MKKYILTVFVIAAMLSLSACGSKKQDTDAPLIACTTAHSQDTVKDLIETWKALHDGYDAQLVVIPDKSDAAEIKITELRTQIMSGGGPDVFILPTLSPIAEEEGLSLFPNPEKLMHSEIFLPLDTYMEQAEYMHPDAWNQAVLSAGRTDEGQLLLPLYYRYSACAFHASDVSSDLPSSWEEWLTCEDRTIAKNTAFAPTLVFQDIFGRMADYQNNALLITEDDITARAEEAVSYGEKGLLVEDGGDALAFGSIGSSFFTKLAQDKTGHVIFAYPCIDGGIAAGVTKYAAISRNTAQHEKAFSLLDVLFSDELMFGYGFRKGERIYGTVVI